MLSVIVVHYKNPDALARCLASLEMTIHETPYELIVVESMSTGTTEAMLAERFPKARRISFEENTGYAKAVNAGIASAKGTYLLILNYDVIASDGAVDALMRDFLVLERTRRAGMAGPRQTHRDGTFQPTAFRFYTPLTIVYRRTFLGALPMGRRALGRFFLDDKNIERAAAPMPVDWLMGSVLLVSRKAVEAVGGMDERFFMYFEDVDWARRFWENGLGVFYVPGAHFEHAHGKGSGKKGIADALFRPLARAHIKSGLLYFLKYRFRTTHYV
ncbi:hypothetical protein A2988_04440 [Candidatus Azambacteria bacterium RIFCSPLOWO2_01_FULL_46_25]|uniref:Glycosyltransferase 2-like domain-containing protein n=1 Tax=Candidatus Azambacteria bacterium RIFCSPLOWO2_01_FULL_46_25 TaxID=1797298 RepID=A0A1F5BVT0_9BACT|nr:MAG: hypothetical protein A2988_04440 [Candidatus Azambacteria bacterium RIFCSPLOWO2_01_FULL_46_25]OGD37010.1 MAG: hypothetical protein A2850_03775 [Candidatus Azambacteria bacterium RIFCSPHIGHO2_01_FULL_51_74]